MQITDLHEVPHVAKDRAAGLLAVVDRAPGRMTVEKDFDQGQPYIHAF